MQLYCLDHSFLQRCPSCNDKMFRMYVYAETAQEAATSEDALCVNCVQVATEQIPHIVHILHGWYGFDLDGCLAKDVGANIMTIGEPIPAMVERLKWHLSQGHNCKIFTARVAMTGAYSSVSMRFDDASFVMEQIYMIHNWCVEHIGHILPVTAVKDFACIGIYDDRARQVVPNTGIVLEDSLEQQVPERAKHLPYVIHGVRKLPYDEDDNRVG